jgi:phage terminase small subunit
MSKHTHHETNQEQRNNKEHGAAPFHYDPYKSSGAVKAENISTKSAEENSSIKLRAYQIHQEKGGSDVDNWLQAERSFKNELAANLNS